MKLKNYSLILKRNFCSNLNDNIEIDEQIEKNKKRMEDLEVVYLEKKRIIYYL